MLALCVCMGVGVYVWLGAHGRFYRAAANELPAAEMKAATGGLEWDDRLSS